MWTNHVEFDDFPNKNQLSRPIFNFFLPTPAKRQIFFRWSKKKNPVGPRRPNNILRMPLQVTHPGPRQYIRGTLKSLLFYKPLDLTSLFLAIVPLLMLALQSLDQAITFCPLIKAVLFSNLYNIALLFNIWMCTTFYNMVTWFIQIRSTKYI